MTGLSTEERVLLTDDERIAIAVLVLYVEQCGAIAWRGVSLKHAAALAQGLLDRTKPRKIDP